MKIRLHRGPFNGKVLDHAQAGRDFIQIRGPKPMTRKQRMEWEREQWDYRTHHTPYMQPFTNRVPAIMATYKQCMRVIPSFNGTLVTIPLVHPDGSLFYEWDKQKPVEY